MQKIYLPLLEAALNQINLMYCCEWPSVECAVHHDGNWNPRMKEVIPFKQIGIRQDRTSPAIMSHKYISCIEKYWLLGVEFCPHSNGQLLITKKANSLV